MAHKMSITWAAAVVAGLLVGPGAPARASGPPTRASATSAYDAQPVKQATARCPAGSVRQAGGGAVNYGRAGGSGVTLAGIVPDDEGESITVTAAASPGRAGDWSVTAVVVCDRSVQPVRIAATGEGTATAQCPQRTRLFGAGFRMGEAPSAAHVREVGLDAGLTRVRVVAGGSQARPAKVTAIALCRSPAARMRLASTTTAAAGWAATAEGRDTVTGIAVYATGAAVTGPAAATLDAIMPGPGGRTTWARATLIGVSPRLAGRFRGEQGSLTLQSAQAGP